MELDRSRLYKTIIFGMDASFKLYCKLKAKIFSASRFSGTVYLAGINFSSNLVTYINILF